ncbi:MAG: hypothetical protein ACI9P7_001026 [Candidatus Azotimanducaceae bacterium]|jgi:hypothetical protein
MGSIDMVEKIGLVMRALSLCVCFGGLCGENQLIKSASNIAAFGQEQILAGQLLRVIGPDDSDSCGYTA